MFKTRNVFSKKHKLFIHAAIYDEETLRVSPTFNY